MAIAVGTVGIDYSGFRPSPAQVKRDGAGFIIRYSAGVGNGNANTQWKLCGTGEIKAAVAAGLDFIANSEWYETRITEGKAAGAADGHADLAFWRARGLAKGASIYVSWDAYPSASKWTAADAYLRAYNAALGGYYHVDCYAGTQYLKHAKAAGIIRYGWRPNAGSWSNDGLPYQPSGHGKSLIPRALAATPAAIWQTGNYWYSKNADENLILRSAVGSHLQALHPPTPPAPPPLPPTPASPVSATASVDPVLEWIMTLPGAPKGLTYAQLKKDIAVAVWSTDNIVPSPDEAKSNPYWAPASYLRNLYNLMLSTKAKIK